MKLVLVVRSVIFEVGRALLIVVFALLAQLFWLTPYKVRYAFLQNWTRLTLAWLKLTCGLTYRVHGQEKIDTSRPGIIMAHHESAWETIAVQRIFPRQCYVLKKELMSIPFFGWTMAMLNPIAIDRKAGRKAIKQLLEQGRQRLEERGDWIVIYPEGTRVPANTIGKINRGGALLAKETNAPIYLVTHNSGSFWPKNSLLRKPGVIDVYIQGPLDPEQMTIEQINQAVFDWISSHQVASNTKNQG